MNGTGILTAILFLCIAGGTSLETFAQSASSKSGSSLINRLPIELERYSQQIDVPSSGMLLQPASRSRLKVPQYPGRRSKDDVVDDLARGNNPHVPVAQDPAAAERAAVVKGCTSAIDALEGFESVLFKKKVSSGRVKKIEELRSPYLAARIWNVTTEPDRTDYPRYVGLIKAYDAACLQDPTGNLAWAPSKLGSVVGLLSLASGGGAPMRFCTAFRVSNTRIATARHCTYHAIAALGPTVFADGKVVFELPLAGTRALVTGPTCATPGLPSDMATPCMGEPSLKAAYDARLLVPRFKDDWNVLEIDDPAVAFPASVDIGARLNGGDRLVVAGLMLHAGFPSDPQGEIDASSWLRLPRAGYCSVVAVTDSCATYGCQTIQGTSGAALLVFDADDRAKVVGIHIGSTDDPGIQSSGCPVRKMMQGASTQGNAGRVIANLIEPFTR